MHELLTYLLILYLQSEEYLELLWHAQSFVLCLLYLQYGTVSLIPLK